MFEDLIKEKPKKISDTMTLCCMGCGYSIDALYEMSACPVCGTNLISVDK